LIDQMLRPYAVVLWPLGHEAAGAVRLAPAPDPLVPVLVRKALKNSADCVGGGRDALYSLRGGAGPALPPM
jgi:hypothetical protein